MSMECYSYPISQQKSTDSNEKYAYVTNSDIIMIVQLENFQNIYQLTTNLNLIFHRIIIIFNVLQIAFPLYKDHN